jgi:predicted component of type VI protein secretion system
MTSDKQIQANRQNALKSTGAKTPEGKAAVRLNAVKHGLLSRETLLPGEDEEALKELGERLRDELQPVGEFENLLVERIIASYWRLWRLGRMEAGIFCLGALRRVG